MGLLYQKRRLKVNKTKRMIASNRAMLQRIRVLLSIFMIIAISYCALRVLKLPQWYIDTAKLSKADPSVLKIQGNLITPDYKIINMIRQTQLPYTQIFRLDTSELENNIAQLQPIKKVYVRRYWFPARLVIAVEERMPAFLLAPNLESEPNSALSSDGILIDHDYLPLNPSIKAKKLLTYGVRNGHDEVWDKKRVDEILKLIKGVEGYSGMTVKYIDLRNQSDVFIMLDEYLIRFGEIDDTILARAKRIASIIPEAKKNAAKLKYIDLRWEDSCYLRLEGAKETTEVKEENKKTTKPEEQKPKQEAAAAASVNENITEENHPNEVQENREIQENQTR